MVRWSVRRVPSLWQLSVYHRVNNIPLHLRSSISSQTNSSNLAVRPGLTSRRRLWMVLLINTPLIGICLATFRWSRPHHFVGTISTRVPITNSLVVAVTVLRRRVESFVKCSYGGLSGYALRFCIPSAKSCSFIERWVRLNTSTHYATYLTNDWRRGSLLRALIQQRGSGIVHSYGLSSISVGMRVRIGGISCKNERRFCSKNGLSIPYKCLATFSLVLEFFRRKFVRLTPYWSPLEVPRGFISELQPVFSYRMMELICPTSPWWVCGYTELAAKTAAFILFVVYDSCLLGALSREMIEGIRRLNFRSELGNSGNLSECRRLLAAIKSSRFRELPSTWSACKMLPSLSPAGTDQGPGFLFYNPFTARFISTSEAPVVLRGMDRQLPVKYPTGWDWSEIDDEFTGLNADLVQLHALLNWWGGEKVNDYEDND